MMMKTGFEREAQPEGVALHRGPEIAGRGRMSEMVRSFHWAATGLGPLESWPETLVAMVNVALSSPNPIAVYWGPDLLTIYNDSYVNLLGWRHPRSLGRPAREVWADLWSLVGEQYQEVLLTGEARCGEQFPVMLERRGGMRETFWNYTLAPIHEQGLVAGIFYTGQDVTENVVTMNKLLENDERLRTALTAGDCVGMWDWRIGDDLVYTEERFARMYGADPRAAGAGVPIASFLERIHPGDLDRVKDAIQATIETGAEYLCEYRLLQPDGTARWVAAKGRCLYHEDGTPQRFPGITIDITAQREERLVTEAVCSTTEFGRERVPEPWAVGVRAAKTTYTSVTANAREDQEPEVARRREGDQRLERSSPVSLTLIRAGLDRANRTSHLGMPLLEDGENLIATLVELTRLAFEEATQPELVRTYMDLARQQLALLGNMVRNRRESTESLPWTTVDVSALAETALQMQERALAKRGLHLVTDQTESPQTEVYMAQMLHAIWDLIGGVLETLAETPTVMPQLH